MKLKHIALIGSLFPILFSLVLFFGVLISADSDDENSNFSSGITGMNLSAEVLKHQPMVEKYAKEYGISEYVNVLLAIIQVESGGTAEDVMQSSESLGLPPNSLDTESSIKQHPAGERQSPGHPLRLCAEHWPGRAGKAHPAPQPAPGH